MIIVSSARTSVPSDTRAEMFAHLEPLFARIADRATPTLVAATVAVPAVDAVDLYAAATPHASIWMQPDRGSSLVGVGAAWSTTSSGRGRFGQVSRDWHDLLEGARIDATPVPRGTGPLLLGGFAFLDDPDPSTAWPAFDAASLVLPALLLSRTPEGAWLTLSLVAEPESSPRADADRLLDTWESLVTDASVARHQHPHEVLRVARQQPEAPQWRDSVARLAGAVGRGRLDKAVLSRRVALTGTGPIDVAAALSRLGESAPESTLFAVTRGSATFMGATPERLVSLEGRVLRTMAMAGSTRRVSDPTADDELAARLVGSDKEREEHAVVVRMVRDALTPLVEDLLVPARPEVERFRHVQHLVTPISGRLRGDVDADVLALVARLHPTPAVGGAPRDLALELIAEEEPDDRGWYCGPLGWIDRHGDGEFVVALRSGLISGSEATIFAGCGIMADSDPEREWEESATKLLALGSALGRIEP